MFTLRKCIILIVAGLCTLLACALSGTDSQPIGTPKGDIQEINGKVLALRGTQPGPIAELVDSILAAHEITRQLNAEMPGLRDQIVRAEVDYQSGLRLGVSETDVANTVNGLAARFNTPEYTQTSNQEVRLLRVQMMIAHPGLIGIEPAFRNQTSRAKFLSEEMSPIEAVHVAATMAFQKMFNPEWQLTKAEQKSHWRARHSGNYTPDFTDRGRSKEVLNAIRGALPLMNIEDHLAIARESLGIMKLGGDQ